MTGILEVFDEHSDSLDLTVAKARREIQGAVDAREETIVQVPNLTTLACFTIALEREGFKIRKLDPWVVQAEKMVGPWKRTIWAWAITPGGRRNGVPPHVVWTEQDLKF